MTPAPQTMPRRKPAWTIVNPGPPTPDAVESLARVCVQIARQRIADRNQTTQPTPARGDDGHGVLTFPVA